MVKYMAYVNQSNEIVIDKYVIDTDANLSMTGDATYGSLYLAYQAAVGSPAFNNVHIRRMDIGGGKTSSTYVHDGKFSFDVNYNGLDSYVTPGNDIISLGVNANGSLEIQVEDTANNSGTSMDLEISGLHDSTSILTNGTDFCTAGCATIAATATTIADTINGTEEKEFQGLTTSASGAVITIEGVWEDDFLEKDLGATISQIMVNKTANK